MDASWFGGLSSSTDDSNYWELPLWTYIIWMVTGPLALLGGLFIILAFLLRSRLREHPGMHFVFWQAVCDFGFTANLVLGAITHNNFHVIDDAWCQVQAFCSQFFAVVCYVFTNTTNNKGRKFKR